MPFVAVRDLTVYYETRGRGPRLLYISGSGGDLRSTPSVFDGALPDTFELVAYDQRGLGQTGGPSGAYSMSDYAEDANGLLAALGWERCLVIGVSFGGMVAQEFAIRHPERVERLVLACTSPGGASPSYPLHEVQGMAPSERAVASMLVSDTRAEAMRAEQPERFEKMVQDTLSRITVGAGEPGRAEGSAKQLEARRHHDTFDRLPSLKMPVYICGGKYDGIAPPANLEVLHKRIAGSTMELFEGGHMFLLQDRSAWPKVIDFLLA
ncbi:MAG: alpha/beta fold hydrolase [Tepidiformaceae bacterium]